MNNKGFTLIEIIIVMAIIVLMSSGSFVGFRQFGKQQDLNLAADNLRNTLNEARSDAASQTILTSTCDQASYTLVGHQVRFVSSASPQYYTLEEVCAQGVNISENIIKRVNLPTNVTFTSAPSSPVRFLVLTGNLSAQATITLNNGSGTKIITIDSSGVIR